MRKLLLLLMLAIPLLAGCKNESADKSFAEGEKSYREGDYDDAIAKFSESAESKPHSAVAFNMIGMSYRFKYNNTRAREFREKEKEYFKKAIEANPAFWEAMINLGATYYFDGDKKSAAPYFKKALELNPKHPEKNELNRIIKEAEAEEGE